LLQLRRLQARGLLLPPTGVAAFVATAAAAKSPDARLLSLGLKLTSQMTVQVAAIFASAAASFRQLGELVSQLGT